MNKQIQEAYENGKLVLFIGAGCSLSSIDQFNEPLLSAPNLAKIIAEKCGWEYNNEPLASVYAAAKNTIGEELNKLLILKFQHCKPSTEYIGLSKYVWPRIYTINIDDAFEKALFHNSPQKIKIKYRFDKVNDQDQAFDSLDYIKLNGSVDRLEDGLIFSANEYGEASAKPPLWYQELAHDYYRYTFLFVGTKLNEPLFYHQLARYRSETNTAAKKNYVLTPSVTPIEKSTLESLNLEHLSGSLEDFYLWLMSKIPTPPKQIDIAFKSNPALLKILNQKTASDTQKFAALFDDVVAVSRMYLKGNDKNTHQTRKVRPFYKGFKPTWIDIAEGVPAEITATQEVYSKIVYHRSQHDSKLIVLYGPAGSGKTTLLKQVALMLSENKGIPCYYLEQPTSNFRELLTELESLHKSGYCFFYDKLDPDAPILRGIITSGLIKSGLIIASESQRKWKGQLKGVFETVCAESIKISEISRVDAGLILKKVEKFGPWTRLSKMSKEDRVDELYLRSKRQLLIGMLESTYGEGFEKIIEREYSEIQDFNERRFVILVGLATMHKYLLKEEYVSRALKRLNIDITIHALMSKLEGIISFNNGMLYARHHVYISHLFNEVIQTEDIFPVIKALLSAYTVYKTPVSKNVGKNELQLFKAMTNHKYLKDLFRSNQQMVLDLYEFFEKDFENDGHFWLQYGLALRDFKKQYEALEKFKTALSAFPNSSHIEHALGQQELIIAKSNSSKVKAYELLDSAKERLENLIAYFKLENAYPIVTLSEGHTSVVRKFESEEQAQNLAKEYANRISSIQGYKEQQRLKRAWIKMTTYATTGKWKDNSNDYL